MLGGLKLGSPFMVSVSFEIMQIDFPFLPPRGQILKREPVRLSLKQLAMKSANALRLAHWGKTASQAGAGWGAARGCLAREGAPPARPRRSSAELPATQTVGSGGQRAADASQQSQVGTPPSEPALSAKATNRSSRRV